MNRKNVNNNSKVIRKKRLLSTSIMAGMLVASVGSLYGGISLGEVVSTNIFRAPAPETLVNGLEVIESSTYQGFVYCSDNLGDGIEVPVSLGVNVTFEKEVDTHSNDAHGISLEEGASVIFNSSVSSNLNEDDGINTYKSGAIFSGTVESKFNDNGIIINDSNNEFMIGGSPGFENVGTMFGDSVVIDYSTNYGIKSLNSFVRFDGSVTSSNSVIDIAVIGDIASGKTSTGKFNGSVSTTSGQYGIQINNNATGIFKSSVIATNNSLYGIWVNYFSNATFDSTVTATSNATGISVASSDATFSGSVAASNNSKEGIYIVSSDTTFEGAVTSNSNYDGIVINESNTISSNVHFKNNVTFNNNSFYGIKVSNSTAEFDTSLNPSSNAIAIAVIGDISSGKTSTGKFNSSITTTGNQYGIQVNNNATGTFKSSVTATNNSLYGIWVNYFSNATFDAAVTATSNATGFYASDSNISFANDVIATNNSSWGIYLNHDSDVIFNDDVVSLNNHSGMQLNGSNVTFKGDASGVGSSSGKGIHVQNTFGYTTSTVTFERSVLASQNNSDGLYIDSSNFSVGINTTADYNKRSGIVIGASTGTLTGDVQTFNNSENGLNIIVNSNTTFNGKIHTRNNSWSGVVAAYNGTATFNKSVISRQNSKRGFTADSSTVTFNDNVTLSDNSEEGAYINSSTVYFNYLADISDNKYGVIANTSSNIIFNNNLNADDNDFNGLSFYNSSNGTFKGSTISSRNDIGMVFDNSVGTFEGVVNAENNSNHGIYLSNSADVTFKNNVTLYNNDQEGVYLLSNAKGTFNKTFTTTNNYDGVYFDSSQGIFNQSVISGNNANYGIGVDNGSTVTLFKATTVSDNSGSGIFAKSSTMTADDTLFLDSNDNGIYADNSTLSFKSVTAFENNQNGIHTQNNSTSTFNEALSLNSNKKNGFNSSGASKNIFNDTVNSLSNTEYGMVFSNVPNNSFNKSVSTASNKKGGLYVSSSTLTFNDTLSSNNNALDGIYFTGGSGTFQKTVSTQSNSSYGIYFNNSSGIFNDMTSASNNAVDGIYGSGNSNMTFKNVSSINNLSHGIYFDSSTATFNETVTTTGNTKPGIYFKNNSNATFNGTVTSDSNKVDGVYFDTSNATFNNSLTTTNNSRHGIGIDVSTITFNNSVTSSNNTNDGIFLDNSTGIFKGTVTSKNNKVIGVSLYNNSSGTFEGLLTSSDNIDDGIYLKNSTGIFKNDANLSNNGQSGIRIATGANVTFSKAINVSSSKIDGISIDSSTGAFEGGVTSSNNIFDGIYLKNSTGTFKGSITNDNNRNGILAQVGSNLTVIKAVAVSNNTGDGISFDSSTGIFEGDITSANNTVDGIYLKSSTGTFKGSITNESNRNGILAQVGSNLTVIKAVAVSNNTGDGISFDSSTGTFDENIISNSSGAYGLYFDNSTGSFKGDVDISKSGKDGIVIANGSVGNFTKSITSKENKIDGLYFDNASGSVDGSVTVTSNEKTGLHFNNATVVVNSLVTSTDNLEDGIHSSNNSNITFNSGVVANNNGIKDILLDNSTMTFNSSVDASQIYMQNINAALILGDGGKLNSSVVTANAGEGKVTFKGSLDLNNDIGEDAKPVSEVVFSAHDAPKVVNVKASIYANNTLLSGKYAEIAFDAEEDGFTLNTPLEADAAGEGRVTFNGSSKIHKPIGSKDKPLNMINLSETDPEKITELGGNIYANVINIGKAVFKPTKSLTIDSSSGNTTYLKDTTLDLGSNTLTFSGDVIANGQDEITIKTIFDGKNIGDIALSGKNDTIDLTKSKQLTIDITEAPGTPNPEKGEIRKIYLFVANGGELKLQDLYYVKSYNPFAYWIFDNEIGLLYQLAQEDITNIIKRTLPKQQQNIDTIEEENTKLIKEISDVIANSGVDAGEELLARLTNPDAVSLAYASLNTTREHATQVISHRIDGIQDTGAAPPPIDLADSGTQITGVASGDKEKRYGVWFSPFYGMNIQKTNNNSPGYKSDYYGAVIGLDSAINDNTAIGIALSFARTDVKHKDHNTGDKTRSDTYIASIYGTYEITKQFFIHSLASIGTSKVKNKEIRIEFLKNTIAKASYKVMSWGAEIALGYHKKMANNLILTPKFGFDFNKVYGIKYTETGSSLQNLTVKRKAMSRLEVVLGMRLAKSINMHDLVVTPEIHGNIRHGLFNHDLDVSIFQQNSGTSLIPHTPKKHRTLYNAGLGLDVVRDNIWEYNIGYDITLSEKYVAHQGTLKLKLKF